MAHRSLVAAAAATIACAAAAGSAQAAPAGQTLYVQQVGGGTLTGSTLVLRDVAPRITTFTDRPQRGAGSLRLARLVSGWRAAFGGDPPNAALEVQGAPAGRDVAIVELRRPRYDAAARTLTFSIRHLGRRPGRGALRGFARRADGRAVRSFGRATLFVDPGMSFTPVLITFRVPPAGRMSIAFSNTTVDYGANIGTLMTNLNTPVHRNSDNPYDISTSTGGATLTTRSLTFTSGPGGGGVSADVIVGIAAPAGGAPITGTASVPAGGSLALGFAGETPTPIPDGRFSIPFEG